ncbi:MAG: hypothetical protein GF329_07785 [Candidatus Lokiarchaeota archaeon]|nr:hypothetical protein [Candidatus Lokiarchaeota archaeon]
MKRKFRFLLYISLSLLSISLFNLGEGLANLLYSMELFLWKNLILIPIGFFIIALIDSITRDSLDPIKLAIIVGLSVAIILLSDINYLSTYTFFTGETCYETSGLLIIVRNLFLLYMAIIMIYTLFRIFIHAPKSLKRFSFISLVGGILMSLVPMIAVFIPLPGLIPLTQASGIVLFTTGFVLKSDLAFVLPFQVYHLTIIETNIGIALFNHSWNTPVKSVDEDLFSAMIQGISQIVKESIGVGEIKEIKMSEGVLLIHRDEPTDIACVMASTKSSRILRQSIRFFLDKFIRRFSIENPTKVSQYLPATELVGEVFPFIPEYE